MTDSTLGYTLIIANPAAHSGRGEQGAQFCERFFASYTSITRGYVMQRTRATGDARKLAAGAGRFDTVLALGGDGVIHEVVNGLMQLPASMRPQLGIIPFGSGNDYARTLGMARNNTEAALAQLVHAPAQSVELGHVNKSFFIQTLSFGFDAAIALDTTSRRIQGTTQEGEALFLSSAARIVSRVKEGYACSASFDGAAPIKLSTLIFAIQVGPSYGGGFAICPAADPTDGLLDVCYNVKRPRFAHLVALVARARFGMHVNSHVVNLAKIRRAVIDFEIEPPCQVDGESLSDTHFEVEVCPAALKVLCPHTSPSCVN